MDAITTTINKIDEVMAAAKRAKEAGSTRFCMGAAWRELGNKKKAFNNILDMVSMGAFMYMYSRRGVPRTYRTRCKCHVCFVV